MTLARPQLQTSQHQQQPPQVQLLAATCAQYCRRFPSRGCSRCCCCSYRSMLPLPTPLALRPLVSSRLQTLHTLRLATVGCCGSCSRWRPARAAIPAAFCCNPKGTLAEMRCIRRWHCRSCRHVSTQQQPQLQQLVRGPAAGLVPPARMLLLRPQYYRSICCRCPCPWS